MKKSVFLSLFVITFLGFFQTLGMYFWIDDNALIYKLQHINTYSGYWGKGIFGEGPYRHIIDQFVLFYPLFKTNPTPYYAVGMVLYFLASMGIYFFVKTLSKNIYLAWGSAAIFAAGFVGSETMFGITNSWQTSRGIIMAIFTFWLFYKYITTQKISFYIFSCILFFFSLDTVYVRAHGLIFAIFFFDLLFTPVKLNRNSIISFLVRQIPLVTIHYYIYLSNTALVRNFGILSFLQDVFGEKKYVLLSVPFQNIGNLFIPDAITKLIDSFVINNFRVLPQGFSLGSTLAGLSFFALLVCLVSKWNKKEPFLVKFLLFSCVWMIGNMVVFFTRETTLILQTTHRYLSYSFVGLSIFWSTSFYLLAKQINAKSLIKIFSTLTLLVIIVYLILGINLQYSFNQKRSIPARKFFSSFDRSIPNIPRGAVIYFNVANDPQVKGEYNQFFGGMFSEAGNLAILSDTVDDYANDFLVTYDFNELSNLIKSNKVSLDNVFSFYYGKSGLIDTTSQFRKLLSENKKINIEFDGKYKGINPVIDIDVPAQTPSLVQSKLHLSMSVASFIPNLPYSSDEAVKIPPVEKNKIFSYLKSYKNYLKNASASAASYWRDQTPNLAIDGKLETAWRGHRGFWEEIIRGRSKDIEFIAIDLKSEKNVSRVRWTPGFYQLVPSYYKISVSTNSQDWKLVSQVQKRQYLPTETEIVDSFAPIQARYVKMEILKTYGNDGPEIKEFEVVEQKFADLDRNNIDQIRRQPFSSIDNLEEFKAALQYVLSEPAIKLFWMSDADNGQDPTKYIEMPIYADGKLHDYAVALPAEGIYWKKFTIEGFSFPTEISINSVKIDYNSIH